MLTVIIVCEVLFWVVLLIGLAVRYKLGWSSASWLLLASTPVIDAILLVVTLADLARGADSNFSHGLSAFYIGYSLIFGRQTIRWMDRLAAYRFGRQRKPEKEDVVVRHSATYQWRQFRKMLQASVIVVAVLVAGLLLSDPEAQFWLWYWLIVVVFTAVTWFAIGPLRAMVQRRQQDVLSRRI